MSQFILSCESTVDLPYSWAEKRQIPVLFYHYYMNSTTYEDDMSRNPSVPTKFYTELRNGATASTSQINYSEYEDYFKDLKKQGEVLHIVFGSGMTGSFNNAKAAADVLNEEGGHKITVIDSYCSCGGYGILCDIAADDRDNGLTLEETEKHICDVRFRIQHWFYTGDLHYFARTGRISSLANTFASILDIFPMMRLNAEGRIVIDSKVRGKKNIIKKMVDTMEQNTEGGTNYNGRCYILHADEPSDAILLRHAIEDRFPALRGKILIKSIGPIIGAHCGPGTVSLYYEGNIRRAE